MKDRLRKHWVKETQIKTIVGSRRTDMGTTHKGQTDI